MTRPIYLDHNATTPILPEVLEAMLPYLREHFGNPSSEHVYGLEARAGIATARAQVALLLGCDPSEVLFTGGGTEANNLALLGSVPSPEGARVLTTVTEHPATSSPLSWLERRGAEIVRLGVNTAGQVRLAEVEAALSQGAAVVAIMHANNETGTLQPIVELSKMAHARGALMFTDAAQSAGKVPTRTEDLGVDLLSIAGHKLYAPKGVGALFVRRGTVLEPALRGAGHERGLRPGTENVAGIVGLGKACEVAHRDLEEHAAHLRAMTEDLYARLSLGVPGLKRSGHPELCLPNTLSVAFPGVSGRMLLEATPEVAASTGSACHAGNETASAVLLAMGLPSEIALGTVRLTLGRSTTKENVERAARALVDSYEALVTA